MCAKSAIAVGPSVRTVSRRGTQLAVAMLSVAVLAAYHNSFSGPFVFDDPSSIVANPSIRHLWPPWEAFSPPNTSITAQGRPVLNFSLALNYAVSGTAVWSYHAVNVAIHLLAALTLFGIVRRTLLLVRGRHLPDDSTPLALAVALIWAVHPLQTESVTYVIQRAESLMGLFYLCTFYAFIRGATSNPLGYTGGSSGSWGWFGLSAGACLLGMATKEVMVTAPPLVLLYDRVFVCGSWRETWRRHGRVHTALFATWILLAALVLGTGGNRGGSVGFGTGIAWWAYPLTQFQAIARYLWLSLWPHPLIFEYGTFWVHGPGEVGPWALPAIALAAGTLFALRRGLAGGAVGTAAIGFLGAWFLAILAPTSLAPGTTQMIVEHRMYLPLAAVVTAVVLGLQACGRGSSRIALALAVAGFVVVAARRNADYRSEVALWSETVAQRPENPLAQQMLAMALEKAGDRTAALPHYETALRLKPDFALAHDTLGQLLHRLGRRAEAISHYETALQLQPEFADAHDHLAMALAAQGHPAAALGHHEAAVRLRPDFPEAHFNFANTLVELGRGAEAIAHYEAALRLRADYPAAHYNLANTLATSGRAADAVPHYEAAVRLKPDYADAYNNLGAALLELGRRDEAIARFEQALRLDPGFSDTRETLARLRAAAPP